MNKRPDAKDLLDIISGWAVAFVVISMIAVVITAINELFVWLVVSVSCLSTSIIVAVLANILRGMNNVFMDIRDQLYVQNETQKVMRSILDNGKVTELEKIDKALNYGLITKEKAEERRQKILGNSATKKS